MAESVRLLVCTTKGLFLIDSDDRVSWTVKGPLCDGWPINHAAGDPATGTLWAAGGGDWHGAGVWRSEDGGETWALAKLSKGQMDEWAANDPDFAAMIGWTPEEPPFGKDISQVWSLGYAHGVLYAGTKPATLLASRDGGATWDKVDGLTDHPSRPDWNGGAAGLVLHTIVADPKDAKKMWVGISAAGVFATEDGGRTWDRRNRLSNADAHRAPRPPGRAEGRRDRALRAQHGARAGQRGRPALSAEPPRRVPQQRRRAQLGRRDRGAALDLRLPHRGASDRPADDLDDAVERRFRRTLSTGRQGRCLAVAGRRRDMGRDAEWPAAAELLFHCAPAGDDE